MGTYDHKKVLSEYDNGRLTVEMAMGHALQHIDKLYELQATANANRYKLRGRVDGLDKIVATLQKEVARLAASMEKFLSKRKPKSSGKPQTDSS